MKGRRGWSWFWLGPVLAGILFLSGCVSDIWDSYVYPDYGFTRADRLCHPYASCSQGRWIQVGKSEIDEIIDYVTCEDQMLEQYKTCPLRTVTMGFEVGRCMKGKGYELKLL